MICMYCYCIVSKSEDKGEENALVSILNLIIIEPDVIVIIIEPDYYWAWCYCYYYGLFQNADCFKYLKKKEISDDDI